MNTALKLQKPELLRVVSRSDNQSPFSPLLLQELGFTDMGHCWGNQNTQYWQIDTSLGNLCVVNGREVWVDRANREVRLTEVKTDVELTTLIRLIS